MERGLIVRNEGMPLRCEICHQSDRLNPDTGECQRCRDLVILKERADSNYEEEKPAGLVISFGNMQTRAGRATAALLAIIFSATLIGPAGALFLAGVCCFLTGLKRFLNDTALTGWPRIDFAINLGLISTGLMGCCLGGLYFLRLLGLVS